LIYQAFGLLVTPSALGFFQIILGGGIVGIKGDSTLKFLNRFF
jgi:hypothetical protein